MDDFTDRSQFRIGDLLVIPGRLIVVRDRQEIKFEPRWMEVLVMLAEHAGETLSTERLLIEVWGSTIYGDSPVSKTISYIRKSISDDSRKPRYVETVSKVGYRLIAPVSLPEDYRRMPSERWTKGSPYVGLSAFGADHASVFCGRSRIVADLLRAIRVQIENQRRFVLIVGASGCGKTSLLRAGAIPLLTKPDGFDGLRAVSVTTCDLAANGSDPLVPLTAALAAWTLGTRPVFPPQTPEQLKALLTETPEMIEGFIGEAFRRHSERDMAEQPYAHLLLTVDHAETLVATTDIDPDARDAFARVLQALCACPHVMVTMIARGDFYLKLIEALPALAELKAGDGHLDVMAPRYGEIGEIIRSPAWKADLSFETDPETRTRLDDALRDAALSQPDALPLLQHTLQTLYERRNDQRQLTFAAYNDIGGLEGAIAHRAEEVFAALPANVRASLDAILAKLIVIQPDSDAVSARRTDSGAFDADARTLIDAFIAARLFVSDLHKGCSTIGVVHEALLRRWPKAVDWIGENRHMLHAKSRLQRAATRWADEGYSPDHLLNPGRPLSEAQEVIHRLPMDFDNDTRTYLRASEIQYRLKRRIRNLASTALFALTLISIAFAVVAQQARKKAEIRERESKYLSEYLLGPLADELRRRRILILLGEVGTQAIDYLRDRDPEDLDSAQIVSTARAYRTVGEALHDAGKPEEARTSFMHAYALVHKTLSSNPDDQQALFERGNVSFWIGQIDFDKKRYKETRYHWTRYLNDSSRLVLLAPEKKEWIQEESYAHNNLGTLYLRQSDNVRAMDHFMKSLEGKRKLTRIDPENLDYRFDYIDSLSWIASTQEISGRLADAASEYDKQISMLKDLIARDRHANRWRSRLANYMMLSAILETGLGHNEKARILASDAVRILEQLTRIAPESNDIAKDLAKARLVLADVSNSMSDRNTGYKELKAVLTTISQLDEDAKNETQWRWIDARARLALSMIDDDAPPGIEAQRAISDLARLALETQGDEIRESYAYGLLIRGISYARHSRQELAIHDFNSAIKAVEDTSWRNRAFRSWIWAQAMTRSGASQDAIAVRERLSAIGFYRREP